jgi:hypothetical protein
MAQNVAKRTPLAQIKKALGRMVLVLLVSHLNGTSKWL